jgi:DNA ligase (NAD+)
MSSAINPNFIESLGFLPAPFFRICNSIDEVVASCLDQTIKSTLDNYDSEFDGLVIKIMGQENRDLLGSTNHHPRWAIAYKYPAKQATSIIQQIEWQVGRTWILTPVAHIQPVQLSGVTISKVTLHNPDFIKEKGIMMGDHVIIQRSGEVIPYIICTIPQLRDESQTQVLAPAQCPICKETIHTQVADSGNTSYYCINATCPASTKEKIKHFVGRDMMNIEGLGDAIIEQMVDNQIISTYADLYSLAQPNIRMITKNLPGMGDKKIDNIITYLEKSKTKELSAILYALWIPQVGEKTAKVMVDHIQGKLKEANKDEHRQISWESTFSYNDLVRIFQDADFLASIHWIGPETVSSVIDRMSHEPNQKILTELEKYWVQFDNFGSEIKLESNKLEYVRFAISWTFAISRDQIISHLVKQGATYNPNITKNTNLLIVWQNPSSKVTKASKQGIETVDGLVELEKRLELDFGLEKAGLF